MAFLFSCNQGSNNNAVNTDSITTDGSSPMDDRAVYGIDISKYQGDVVEFLNRTKDSLVFVICKATEGVSLTDPLFKTNWSMIEEKGFIRGAYHFYHCGDDTAAQAQYFLSVLDSLKPTDIAPIIDFEEASVDGCPVAGIKINLLAFLRQVESRSARTPIIYTDNNTAYNYLNDPSFSRYPLYIADYNNSQSPLVPEIWKSQSWTIWQRTDSLKLDGGYDDLDLFNGSMTELIDFIQNY